MIYQAMFDEMDEGTAIFKCTNTPPVGESRFVTYEGQPSDHYLWLTGMGGRLLRGETARPKRCPVESNVRSSQWVWWDGGIGGVGRMTVAITSVGAGKS